MHHRMDGQVMSQAQEEMAVIGIFALFWVGESNSLISRKAETDTFTPTSFHSRISILHEQARRRRRRSWCRDSQDIVAGLARPMHARRRVLRIRGVHILLSRQDYIDHRDAVHLLYSQKRFTKLFWERPESFLSQTADKKGFLKCTVT